MRMGRGWRAGTATVSLAAAALALSTAATGQSGTDVDMTLVLAVDCSYSVDDGEFDLQMKGLARAFVSAGE